MRRRLHALLIATAIVGTACAESPESEPAGEAPDGVSDGASPTEIAHFPLNDAGIPSGADAVFDPAVSQDGGGSLRVDSVRGGRLRLYELHELGDVQGAVVYTGFLRSQELDGQAMLEMWCRPAEGEAVFVRGAASAVTGDSDWTPQEIRFSRPEICSAPVSVELNVLIQGGGTVWIDNLRLWSIPTD